MATEVGVFQELAPLCFAALREAMFGDAKAESEEEEEEGEGEDDELYGLSRKELVRSRSWKKT